MLPPSSVIDLCVAQPSDPPPARYKAELINAVFNPLVDRYPAPLGLPKFQEAIVGNYDSRGVQINGDDVIVTCGGCNALVLALMAAGNGPVAVISPYWPHLTRLIRSVGKTLYQVEMVALSSPSRLDRVFAQIEGGTFLLVQPHNPSGATFDSEQLQEIVLAARRHKVQILCDYVFGELYEQLCPDSILRHERNSVEVFSMSKAYRLQGARIAAIVGSSGGTWFERIRDLRMNTDLGVPNLLQIAAIPLLSDAAEVAAYRMRIKDRRQFFSSELAKLGFEIPHVENIGATFIWAKLPMGFTSCTEAVLKFEEFGVKVLAGSACGSAGEGFVRIALNEDIATLKAAALKIGEAIDHLSRELGL